MTFEKNWKSRVLMVCTLEDEASRIDEKMCDAMFDGFRCLSYELDSPMARIAAMRANDMLNVKARFETLYGAKIDDEVLKDGKQSKLEDLLKEQKIEEEPLCIAVEQGSGKSSLDLHIVLNPRTMSQGKKWLVDQCKSVVFKNENNNATSVNEEQFRINIKYNEELKFFCNQFFNKKEQRKLRITVRR